MVDPKPPAGRPAKPDPLADILSSEPVDLPVVEVVGDFFDRVEFVSSTAMSGLLAFAKVGDQTVLVPHVETRIEGGRPGEDSDAEPRAFFSAVLTLENAAFLGVNLVSDLRSACEELATLAGSTTQLERRRLEQTRYLMAHTVREALAATSRLTAVIDSYGPETSASPEEAARNASVEEPGSAKQ